MLGEALFVWQTRSPSSEMGSSCVADKETPPISVLSTSLTIEANPEPNDSNKFKSPGPSPPRGTGSGRASSQARARGGGEPPFIVLTCSRHDARRLNADNE